MGPPPCHRPQSEQIPAHRAPVVPRVRAYPDGEVLPLEHHIQRLLDLSARGLVSLFGPAGSGKTVALLHLGSLFPAASLRLLDDIDGDRISLYSTGQLVIAAGIRPFPNSTAVFEMAPWQDDELIEYLLAVHPERCASVMERLRLAQCRNELQGLPQLWTIVLDQLAFDDALSEIPAALRRHLTRQLGSPQAYADAVRYCTLLLQIGVQHPQGGTGLPHPPSRLLRHRFVAVLLASEALAADLACGRVEALASRLPSDIIRETGRLLAMHCGAVDTLAAAMANQPALQPMAVSILLSAQPAWRPDKGVIVNLSGAHASGARWAGVDLSECDLSKADFSSADLSSASLKKSFLTESRLRRAILARAQLGRSDAERADFAQADLSEANAPDACFRSARFQGARLNKACLRRAALDHADLTRAVLVGADLREASMDHATVEEADFSDANFRKARLYGVRLCNARLAGASFGNAILLRCDLEYVEMPRADFHGADLTGSYLTGSSIPGGDLREACLRDTGLAEVEWEGADLRDADFTGASFHMGSSRSGLVNSPIASEGTRTGFYTDDYDDQDFKSPEEIRKANLCNCDLRGAMVEETDFYLVDLRGAIYTDEQGRHFSRCGAILQSRA